MISMEKSILKEVQNREIERIVEAISRFVLEQTNLEDASILQKDTNLFEAGLFDSLLAVSLIGFCEKEFDCIIDTSELSEENFGTIGALSKLIWSKTMH
jgi:acyl carrier protein